MSCAALDELEKRSSLNFQLAISLLQCFLSLPRPYLAHRRGLWFNRICIDIENVCRIITSRDDKGNTNGSDSYQVVYEGQSKTYELRDVSVVDIELRKYSFLIAHLAAKDSAVRVRSVLLFLLLIFERGLHVILIARGNGII